MSHPGSQHLERSELELSYKKIPFEQRKELIKLVVDQGFSIYRACRLLHINNSTAKAIIRKYKTNGTIFVRKSQQIIQNRPSSSHSEGRSSESSAVNHELAPQIQQNQTFQLQYPFLGAPPMPNYYLPYCPLFFIPFS